MRAQVSGIVIGSAALIAGCGQSAAPENKAEGPKAPERAPSPVETAERLVRERTRASGIRFGAARTYRNGDVAVVCGTYAQPGAAGQRYVAVSGVDVWIEPEMRAGEMDRAFAEFCRDTAANA